VGCLLRLSVRDVELEIHLLGREEQSATVAPYLSWAGLEPPSNGPLRNFTR